jgi:hypothetical protein
MLFAVSYPNLDHFLQKTIQAITAGISTASGVKTNRSSSRFSKAYTGLTRLCASSTLSSPFTSRMLPFAVGHHDDCQRRSSTVDEEQHDHGRQPAAVISEHSPVSTSLHTLQCSLLDSVNNDHAQHNGAEYNGTGEMTSFSAASAVITSAAPPLRTLMYPAGAPAVISCCTTVSSDSFNQDRDQYYTTASVLQ